jgi:hypothetical protein
MTCSRVGRYIIPVVCALPLWFRFCQCLRRYYDTNQRHPHLSNALKYALSHLVVIMVAYHPTFQHHHSSSSSSSNSNMNINSLHGNGANYTVSNHPTSTLPTTSPSFLDDTNQTNNAQWILYRQIWIAAYVISTLYAFLWDVFMDW